MRLLLDTSYLMPLIRVEVKGIDPLALTKAMEDHEIIVSQIQLFELYAKGVKYAERRAITKDDVVNGVEAANHDLKTIPFATRRIMETAMEANLVTGDIIDAMILATALHHADAISTIDPKITEAYAISQQLKQLNPNLKIYPLGR